MGFTNGVFMVASDKAEDFLLLDNSGCKKIMKKYENRYNGYATKPTGAFITSQKLRRTPPSEN